MTAYGPDQQKTRAPMQPAVAGGTDLRQRLAGRAPWLDVRAPCEWSHGHIRGAVNLPLLDDDERRQVGICYKAEGQRAAIALGNRLVSGAVREQRVGQWRRWLTEHGDRVAVYCARGGLRSQTVVDWLRDAVGPIPRITGGYQCIRRELMATLVELPPRVPWLVVGGSTGVGKTEFLHAVSGQTVDLEGLANHRGSAFGAWPEPQPSQATFENFLAQDLLALDCAPSRVLIEDESRWIGERRLPPALFDSMQQAPLLALDAPLDERVERILRDYVLRPVAQRRDIAAVRMELLGALQRIRRSLGGARYGEIERRMDVAWSAQELHGDTSLHRSWIEYLCVEYYDPYYERHLARMQARVIARGTRAELLEFVSGG